MTPSLILASASPARTKLLSDAGIAHSIRVSDVDEDAVTAAAGPLSPAETSLLLARAKAEAIAADQPDAAHGALADQFNLRPSPRGSDQCVCVF